MATIVEMLDINKYFPGVKANDHISIKIEKGEIHGLLGENGSGKTTLMNILFGLYQPDSGKILVNDLETIMEGPKTAINLGIEMIHQHFMLIKPFTVAENIILGEEPTKYLRALDRELISYRISELIKKVGIKIDPNAVIEDISVGLQQRVEILKALYRKARILILDEPTAVLTPQEANELFVTLGNLKKQGVTIIFITHKLREIMAVCDRVTVLRRGKVVGTEYISNTSVKDLANMMVGREVLFRLEKEKISAGKVILDVKNLSAIDDRGLLAVNNVSFTVRKNEIVGIAGVQGNGQTELVESVTGLRKVSGGEIEIDGLPTTNYSSKKVLDSGVAHIPEDRQGRGLILSFSIKENMILGIHQDKSFSSFTVLNEKKLNSFANDCISNFDIKLADIESPVRVLSGGNQQKVILARELLGREPKVIIAAQPTRGLDVGVIEYVHKTLLQIKAQGQAILLVSPELDEIRTLADRAYVMFQGEIMAEVDPNKISDEKISLLMAGVKLE